MANNITDKAEVSIDFPDKFYVGSFGRGSRFDVTADEEGIHLHLDRADGEKRHVGFHIHYALLAEILAETARTVANVEKLEQHHRERLCKSARLWNRLEGRARRKVV